MSTSEASNLEAPRSRRGEKAAIFAAKLLVSGVCFWYVSRQIDLNQVLSAIPLLDLRWAALAILIAVLEIPLVGLRWYDIIDSLGARPKQVTRIDIIAATAVGAFFAQVLPSVAGDGMRAWLLVRLGGHWRTVVTSVIIDRGVGLALLIALGFAILLLPSDLTAFEGYRDVVRAAYGMMILAGVLGLLLAPKIAMPPARWRYSRWFATLATDIHRVLLGSKGATILSIGCLIHALTIVIVWLLGRAQGLVLPLTDAAVLFTVMVAVLLVPISISGWGVRELAVVSLLGAHGVAPERALLFSVCFGLTATAGCLPGALAWLAYPFPPIRRPPERGT
jgi:glycosyltransferase 2 family protein